MERTLTSAARAVRSLLTPGIPGVFLRCALLSLVSVIVLLLGLTWLMNATVLQELTSQFFLGLGLVQAIIILMLTILLFPLLLPLIVSFFDERIAQAIEVHEYPNLPLAQPQPLASELWHDLRFSLYALFLNIVSLPLYLVPGLNAVWFFLLNGYLLGKEFFLMAALRHVNRAKGLELFSRHRIVIYAGGLIIVVSATIPFLNLAAPFWGVAMMVHLFHQLYPAAPPRVAHMA